MTLPAPPVPELHRPFAIDRIGAGGTEQRVLADAAECAALAVRLGVPAVRKLSCRFHLTLGRRGVVTAEGELRARLVRVCVVSLDEFETDIAERFRVRFVPAARLASEGAAESDDAALLDPEADDEIPYEDASIDLGEAAAEQLALTLDPYPRRPDATLPEEAVEAPESPFAALARLRRPDGGGT